MHPKAKLQKLLLPETEATFMFVYFW